MLSYDQLLLAHVAVLQVLWCCGLYGDDQQQQQLQLAGAASEAEKALGAAAGAAASSPEPAAVAAAADKVTDRTQVLTPQLFSLALSAVKCAAATASVPDSEMLQLQLQVACCLLGSSTSSSTTTSGSSSSSSSSRGDGRASSSASVAGGRATTESAVLQVVLVVRSLQLLGVLLEGLVAAAEEPTATVAAAIEAAIEAAVTRGGDARETAAAAAAAEVLAAAELSDEAAADVVAAATAAAEASSRAATVDDADRVIAARVATELVIGKFVEESVAQFFEYEIEVTPWYTATPLQCMAQAAAWLQQQLPLLAAGQQQTPAAAAAAAATGSITSCHHIPGPVADDLLQRISCLAVSASCSTWQDLKQQFYQQQQQQQQQQNEQSPAAAASLAQTLQQLGAAVASQLPLPYCCNNPACSNLDALSEQVLVSGKSTTCGGCRLAHYCSDTCYRAHWKAPEGHRKVCKRLQAAAAAAADQHRA
jgi:hypothetical protein